MQSKINTLCKVANGLNREGITWALGGSGALYFLGMVDSFRDVDLMLAPEDVQRAQQVFSDMAGLEYAGFEEKYDLFQYRIDGMDFDVMQGFRFGEYCYTLRAQDMTEKVSVEETDIFLHSLHVWRKFYTLMERNVRVALIDTYLQQRGATQ